MVSLKNGVSERGGRPMARMVLEVSFPGGVAGSAPIITVSGPACPDTQRVLFTVGVETAIDSFPTWDMGKKRFQASHGKVIIFLGLVHDSRLEEGKDRFIDCFWGSFCEEIWGSYRETHSNQVRSGVPTGSS